MTLPLIWRCTPAGQVRLAELGLKCSPDCDGMPVPEGPHLVCAVDTDIRLIWAGEKGPSPLVVDFTQGKMGYRQRVRGRERLLDAVRPRQSAGSWQVLDATGGLGRDAWMMAAEGMQVWLVERHPVLHAMLADGLARAAGDPAYQEIASRIRLIHGEAQTLLEDAAQNWDVVYLDPMFPPREKSAAVKKDMQFLHALLGAGDPDSDALLAPARCRARHSVVVKRPRHAPFLGGLAPHHQIAGKRGRFDVYTGLAGRERNP